MYLTFAVRPYINFTASPPLPIISMPYAGVLFNLTCVVELISAIDVPVTVSDLRWTREDDPLPNTSRITIFPFNMSSRMYESSIMFNPLSNQNSGGDNGTYTCLAMVQPTASMSYIDGGTFKGTQTLTVEGKFPVVSLIPFLSLSTLSPLCTCLSPDPIPTSVEITDSGDAELEQEYTLTCHVTVVEGLIVNPRVEWYGTTNITDDNDHTLSEPVTQGLVTSRTLTFKSLRTSLARMYECRGIVNIPSIALSGVTNSSMFPVVVKGMQVNIYPAPMHMS